MKRNLMKEAHKMTKKIKEQYPEVDYKAQLGLCLSFLSQEGGEEMVELKGTEKQVKYANDLIERMKKENDNYEKKLAGKTGRIIEEARYCVEVATNYILSLEDAGAVIKNLLFYGGGIGMKIMGQVLVSKEYKVRKDGLVREINQKF